MFLLDDLLWVLTDSQLKAMMKYAESLSEAREPVQVRGETEALGGGGEVAGDLVYTSVGGA